MVIYIGYIEFEDCAKAIDFEVKKMPNFKEFLDAEGYANWQFKTLAENLERMLEYLKASNIKKYPLHNYMLAVEFSPFASPYFKLSEFGLSAINEWRNGRENKRIESRLIEKLKDDEKHLTDQKNRGMPAIVNETIRGRIGVGFDDGGDYGDKDMPSIIIQYLNEPIDFCSDIEVFYREYWKDAINEFFDINKAIGRQTVRTAIPSKPYRKTKQLDMGVY